MNLVIISGNLTREPEMRTSASGARVLDFSVAVNERRKVNDEWTDVSHFFRCVSFGNRADGLVKVLRKGLRVTICGKLQQERWKDKEGNSRESVSIVVDEVELPPKQKADGEQPPNRADAVYFEDDIPF